jgi:hypothetical protein
VPAKSREAHGRVAGCDGHGCVDYERRAACKTGVVRKLLSRLFGGPSGGPTTVGSAPPLDGLHAGQRADPFLLDPDANDVPPPSGEPAPVEANEDAWEREREQRERDGR